VRKPIKNEQKRTLFLAKVYALKMKGNSSENAANFTFLARWAKTANFIFLPLNNCSTKNVK
jgi:hypothetical protein